MKDKKTHQNTNGMINSMNRLLVGLAFVMIFLYINSCGNNSPAPSIDKTSVIFSIKWQGIPANNNTGVLQKPDSIDCASTGVSKIEANIYDRSNKLLAGGGPWNCDSHSGAVTGSLAGTNRKIIVTGKDSDGNILYRGERTGVTITNGQTTDIGTITVSYVEILPAPTGVAATGGNGEITITWENVTGATGYIIYIHPSSDVSKSNYTKKRTSSANSFTWPYLSNCSTFYFVVVSEDGGAESIESVGVNATPINLPFPNDMVLVTGGCFQMGDTFGVGGSDETPVHQVCVDDFYIGEHEITLGEWKAVMGNLPSYSLTQSSCGDDDCPVARVLWNEAQDFIATYNAQAGETYRLPTEAEWEYAARAGGQDMKYAGTSDGSELGDYAWYLSNSGMNIHKVKTKKPNSLCLYDMSGNVWEWVQDWYSSSYYSNSPQDNPTGPDSGSGRVKRGGGRGYSSSSVRAAYRGGTPSDAGYLVSFRLARTSAENNIPVSNASPDQSVVTGSSVTLDGSKSVGANGASLTYTWEITSSPDGSEASLSNPNDVNPTFTADKDGTYTISLVVNDNEGNTSTDEVKITALTILTDGLVAYYPFNGNANDESGNGNDGKLMGGASINNSLIIGYNASDALSLPHSIVNGLSSFSFSARLKINTIQTAETQYPLNIWFSVAKGSPTPYSGRLDNILALAYWSNDKKWYITVNNDNLPFSENTVIEDKEWHHVVILRENSTARLYIDGNEVGNGISVPSDSIVAVEDGFIIGQEQDDVGSKFDKNQSWAGEIDDIAFYNRALSESEIHALYNNGQFPNSPTEVTASAEDEKVIIRWNSVPGADSYNVYWFESSGVTKETGTKVENVTSPYAHSDLTNDKIYYYVVTAVNNLGESGESEEVFETPRVSVIQTDGLVAYYPFNGNANDESGNENHGTVNGAILTTDRFGNENSAYSFDGVDDFIKASATNLSMGDAPRAITAWIKDKIHKDIWGVIHYGQGDCTGKMFGLASISGGVRHWGGCKDTISNLNIPLDQWTFIAIVYDGDTITFWVNDQSYTITSNGYNTQDSNFFIGAETINNGDSFRGFFNGLIDDVFVYNRALSEDEIRALFDVSNNEGLKPPIAPTGLTATYGDQLVAVNWDSVSDATSYNLYWSNSSDISKDNFEGKISDITGNSYTLTGISNGNSYYFLISAVNAQGESDVTLNLNEEIFDNILTYNGHSYGITKNQLTWAEAKTLAEQNSAYLVTINDSEENQFLDDNYSSFWIGYNDINSEGEWVWANGELASYTNWNSGEPNDATNEDCGGFLDSAKWNDYPCSAILYAIVEFGTSITLPPDPPTGIDLALGNSQLTITWSNVTGADSYNIYWANSPGITKETETKIENVTSPYVHSDLTNNITYYYVVTAINGGGESSESIESSQLLPPATPTGVKAWAGDGKITIRWDDVMDVDSYNIYWSESLGVSQTTGTLIENATSPYTHQGVSTETTYYYVVTSNNNTGESLDSAEVNAAPLTPFYSFDFENGDGWGDWYADNGIWEVGTPASGPEECFDGFQCAATELDGDYAENNESRLISPKIQLPDLGIDEEIRLRFKHWVAFDNNDLGRVQIKYETDPESKTWSDWENLTSYNNSSGDWAYPNLDISDYAGQKVQIAFWIDQSGSGVGPGWYIDDVVIIIEQNVTSIISAGNDYMEDFESGWGDWWTDNGIWEIGMASSGPDECYSGSTCVATELDGEYAENNESRLISPKIQLPDLGIDEEIRLRFRHWAGFDNDDTGRVQIKYETDPDTKTWSDWENLASYKNSSGDWAYPNLDISDYAGQKVQIAFWIDQSGSGVGPGWYIDDILINVEQNVTTVLNIGDIYSKDFESGWGDWWADNGIWEIGSTTSGPGGCYNNSMCAATELDGDYAENNESRLYTPYIQLPDILGDEEIRLRFRHWAAFDNDDKGKVQIRYETDSEIRTWSDWKDLASYTNSSGDWAYPVEDLSGYEGKKVQIAFFIDQAGSGVGPGWYIDEFLIQHRIDSTPIAVVVTDQYVITGSTATLDGSESRNASTYAWILISSPDGSAAALSDSTSVNPVFTTDQDGEYVISLVVSDGTVDSEKNTITITASQTPLDGLVAYYQFSGNANDERNGNNGTIMGGATVNNVLATGNNAVDALSLPHTIVNGLTDFTFSANLKISTINDSNTFLSGARGSKDNAIFLSYKESESSWRIHINGTVKYFDLDTQVEDNQWHYVVILRKRGTARLYIDGAEIGIGISVSDVAISIDQGGFIVGQEQDSVGGRFEQSQSWAGEIDNLRIYNRALTEEEIQILNQ